MTSYAPITTDMTSSDAFGAVLAHNFDRLVAWQDKARTWDDTEGVHQLRVSFRRLRSAFSVFRQILERDTRKFWMNEIKALADQTSLARDIDVLIEEGLPAFYAAQAERGGSACETTLNTILIDRRETAYEQVRAMLDSAAYKTFGRDFATWIDAQGWAAAPPRKRKRQQTLVIDMGRRILDRQDGDVLSFGRKADPGDAAEMHRLRIACKKLRYASEFFSPVFEGMDAYLKRMKGLQDILGLMHDAAVIQDLMDDALPADADAELRACVAVLVNWRTLQYQKKSRSFAAEWDAFESAPRPWSQGGK
jgi:CHAD domain-containing protein